MELRRQVVPDEGVFAALVEADRASRLAVDQEGGGAGRLHLAGMVGVCREGLEAEDGGLRVAPLAEARAVTVEEIDGSADLRLVLAVRRRLDEREHRERRRLDRERLAARHRDRFLRAGERAVLLLHAGEPRREVLAAAVQQRGVRREREQIRIAGGRTELLLRGELGG